MEERGVPNEVRFKSDNKSATSLTTGFTNKLMSHFLPRAKAVIKSYQLTKNYSLKAMRLHFLLVCLFCLLTVTLANQAAETAGIYPGPTITWEFNPTRFEVYEEHRGGQIKWTTVMLERKLNAANLPSPFSVFLTTERIQRFAYRLGLISLFLWRGPSIRQFSIRMLSRLGEP